MAPRKDMHPTPTEPALYGERRRVAVVTGAAKGLGRAISLRLARDGLNVAINDLKDTDDLRGLKKEIEETGMKCAIVAGDVSDEKVVERIVGETAQALGFVDVMVANAGIAAAIPLLDITDADMDRMFRINVRAVHLCYKFAAKQMIKQGTGGKLIAACSLAGYKGTSTAAAYVASKFAVRGYNQTAALELAKYGITCNCYAPGFIATDMAKPNSDPASDKAQKIIQMTVQSTPLKRIGVPEDVSNLVSFLVSRNSDYITGQAIPVGGGYHML